MGGIVPLPNLPRRHEVSNGIKTLETEGICSEIAAVLCKKMPSKAESDELIQTFLSGDTKRAAEIIYKAIEQEFINIRDADEVLLFVLPIMEEVMTRVHAQQTRAKVAGELDDKRESGVRRKSDPPDSEQKVG